MNKSMLFVPLFAVGLLVGGCATPAGKTAGKVKPYPLDTCIVSDNELGSMGDPVPFVHEGQEYKVCCKPCIKKFKADPERYVAYLKEAQGTP